MPTHSFVSSQIDVYYPGGFVMDGASYATGGQLYLSNQANGTVEVSTSTTYAVRDSSGDLYTLTGSDFTYNGARHPLSGTGSELTVTVDGALALRLPGHFGSLLYPGNDPASLYPPPNVNIITANTINGGPGDDELRGWGDGTNSITGGAGEDTLFGAATLGGGPETLFGGDGADLITTGDGFNQVNGNKGDDTIVAERGGGWLCGGQGADNIDASRFRGQSIINGNLGDDTLTAGGDGAPSTLRGGQGDDLIHGGAGDDQIYGDLGDNTLTGGAGADTFHAGHGVARDVITDFQSEVDWGLGDRVQIDASLTYTVSQVSTDVEIDVSSGDVIVLRNTQLLSLSDGWLVHE